MASFIPSGLKLFVPSRHVWLRAMQIPPPSQCMSMPSSSKVLQEVVSSRSHGGAPDDDWRVDVGLTCRGIEDIGDVQDYEFNSDLVQATTYSSSSSSSSPRRILTAETETVLTIHWDAHRITAADELYHTVWETISEQTLVKCPVNGWVEHINASLLLTTTKERNTAAATPALASSSPDVLEEDTVLFTIRTNEESIQSQFHNFCSQEEYEEMMESSSTSTRGRFYDG
jgi:hypothetical protein